VGAEGTPKEIVAKLNVAAIEGPERFGGADATENLGLLWFFFTDAARESVDPAGAGDWQKAEIANGGR